MNEQHAILIENMHCDMSVGIYEEEHHKRQNVIITLKATTTQNRPITDIDETVCYHTLYKDITALTQSKHFELLEELAEDIAQICFLRQNIKAITLSLKKTDAIDGPTLVGVELVKSRI